MNATVDAVPGASVQWFRDGVRLEGQTNAALRVEGVRPLDSGDYKVVAWNTSGTNETGVVAVSVRSLLKTSVTGSGEVLTEPLKSTYSLGESVTLTAVPNGTAVFAGWEGDATGDVNPLVLRMDDNRNVTARFKPTFPVLLSRSGSGVVRILPEKDRYVQGERVTLQAEPAAGWGFASWSGGVSSLEAELSVPVERALEIVGNFKPLRGLTLGVDGTGTVQPSAEGPHLEGTVVTVRAVPAAGWAFAGWAGDATGKVNPLAVTVDQDKTVKAVFLPLFTVTPSVSGKGAVTFAPSQASYMQGAVVSVSATPQAGWRFMGWSGDLSGTANPAELTVDGNKSITATFLPLWQLTLGTNGTGGIVVTPAADKYVDGTVVQLEAQPGANSVFSGWSGATNSVTNPLNWEFKTNATLVANFLPTYELKQTLSGEGTLKLEPAKARYTSNELVTVTAQPADGWALANWSVAATGNAASVQIRMTKNQDLGAVFKRVRALNLSSEGEGTLAATPASGPYLDGTVVTLRATPATGWAFSGWSGDATGKANPLALTLSADRTVKAVFVPLFTVTPSVVGKGAVTLSPSQATYMQGSVVSLTATPQAGWRFMGWSGDLSGTANPADLTVDAAKAVTATFLPLWQLTLGTNGTGGIVVTPAADKYVDGTVVQLEAKPGANAVFSGWTGATNAADNPLNWELKTNATLVANFLPTYELKQTLSGEGTLKLEPAKARYTSNELVTVTAQPSEGWALANWSVAATGNAASVQVRMTKNQDLGAVFKRVRALNLSSEGEGTLAATPASGPYLDGAVVTLRATPATGWAFSGWSGDATGKANPLALTLSADRTVKAVFVPLFTVTPSVVGKGAVTLSPSQATYLQGSVVSLTANPQAGWRFMGWSGDLSGTANPADLTVDAAKAVTATFLPLWQLTLGTNGSGGIVLTPAADKYVDGTVVQLEAKPATNAVFVGWTGATNAAENPLNWEFKTNATLVANFLPTYELKQTLSGEGTLKLEPAKSRYTSNELVTVTAQPAEGWALANWSVAATGSAPSVQVRMTKNQDLGAVFKRIRALNLSSEGEGSVAATPASGPYLDGVVVTLKATPAEGWAFAGWSGDASGKGNPLALTLSADRAVKAVFLPLFTVTPSVVGKGTVTLSPSQATYMQGSVVSLTATPQAGWRFMGWSGDLSGTANPADLTVDAAKAVTATFLPLWQLTLGTNGSGGIVVTPAADRYVDGTIVQLEAKPATNVVFVGWTGSTNSAENPLNWQFKTNGTLVANFLPTYRLIAGSAGAGELVINPTKERYVSNELVSVTAKPAEGWGLAGWSGAASGTATTVEFRMTSERSISATFKALRSLVVQGQEGQGTVEFTPAGGRYLDGTAVSALAKADAGWTFLGWGGADAGKPNPVSLVLTADRVLQPRFAQLFTVSAKTNGNGTVVLSPSQQTYVAGSAVSAKATASPGWRFVGWSGDVTGVENPLNVVVDLNKVLTAEFRREWTLVATAGSGGTVEVDPTAATYVDGTTVQVRAVPQTGFEFAGWTDGATGTQNPLSVTLTANRTVKATFADAAGPSIDFESVVAGTVTDGIFRLAGRITDNVAVVSAGWSLNGGASRALTLASDGRFAVEGIELQVGKNQIVVTARDASGKESSRSIEMIFAPQRLLAVRSVAEVQEGRRVSLPVELESQGEVGGLTLVLRYDPAQLTDPQFEWSAVAGAGVVSVNLQTEGEVRASMSLPATALPSGVAPVGVVNFRTRSVAQSEEARVTPQILDMAAPTGNRLTQGNGTLPGSVTILPRRVLGDNNANQRIDIGDATIIQRLLTAFDEVRPWDVMLNDLNGSQDLDSGDVIRVLRVVVGLDSQPGPRVASGRLARAGNTGTAERAELVLPAAIPVAGQTYKVQFWIRDLESRISGVTTTLRYSTNALRLAGPASLKAGGLAPNGSLVVWNVSPAQTDFAKQDGLLSLAISSGSLWPSTNGLAAEFEFVVQPGVTDQASWAIELGTTELVGDGFDIRTLPEVTATFAGRPVAQPVELAGAAVDGYIAGATVWFDANLNQLLDGAEPFTTTDRQGQFKLTVDRARFDVNKNGVLDPAEGRIALTGGLDVATGTEMVGTLTAPPGSKVVTPLTTLLDNVLRTAPGTSLVQAEEKVLQSLGLPAVPLTQFDPLAAAQAGDIRAAAVQAAAAQVSDTVQQIAAVLAASSPQVDTEQAAAAVTQAIAKAIVSGSSVDLSSTQTVQSALTTASADTGVSLPSATQQAVVEVISANNEAKAAAASAASSPLEAVQQIAQIQTVAQGETVDALVDLGEGKVGADDVTLRFTGDALANVIDQAPVGDLFGTGRQPGTFEFLRDVAVATESGQALESLTVVRREGSSGIVRVELQLPKSPRLKVERLLLEFADGELQRSVDPALLLVDNTDPEAETEFVVRLQLASDAPNGTRLGAQSQTALRVIDNDAPGTIGFADLVYTVGEDGSALVPVVLERTGGTAGAIRVNVIPASGTAQVGKDVQAGAILVEFAPGQVRKIVDLPIVNDLEMEATESFTVGLELLPGSAPGAGLVVGATTAEIRIQDNNKISWQLSLGTNGLGDVLVSPVAVDYADGAVVSLEAKPSANWVFTGWTGSTNTAANPLSWQFRTNATLVANFLPTYELKQTVTGQGSLTLEPAKARYTSNEVVTVTAKPANGWALASWSGAASGNAPSIQIRITKNLDLGAVFKQVRSLTLAKEGQGEVTPSPATGPYLDGAVVTLNAVPATGWEFAGWSGDASGASNPLSLTLDANKSVKALFLPVWRLTLGTNGVGSVVATPSAGSYVDGAVVSLEAKPGTDWVFTGWTGSTNTAANPLSWKFRTNSTLVANFLPTYELKQAVTGQGSLTLEPSKARYTSNEVVTVTAKPANGWGLASWSGSASGNAPSVQIRMTKNLDLGAVFKQVRSLTLTKEGQGEVTPSPATGPYLDGAVVTLNAVPATGWEFAGWSGDASGASNPLSITLDNNKSVKALFRAVAAEPARLEWQVTDTGVVRLLARGKSGARHRLESSLNLTTWSAEGATTVTTTGDGTPVEVPIGSQTPIVRFFRLILAP
jgi:NOL1/NOP2/fmu family ribosome biogenesis protein